MEFRGSGSGTGRGFGGDGSSSSGSLGGGDNKGSGATGSDQSLWQMGMSRRNKGDSRRTRVSFLLF